MQPIKIAETNKVLSSQGGLFVVDALLAKSGLTGKISTQLPTLKSGVGKSARSPSCPASVFLFHEPSLSGGAPLVTLHKIVAVWFRVTVLSSGLRGRSLTSEYGNQLNYEIPGVVESKE